MNYELSKKNLKEAESPCLFRHTSYFILHTSSQGGQAITLAALFFLIISLTIGLGVVNPVLNQVESVRSMERSNQSFYGAEAVSQDVLYRLSKGLTVGDVETLVYGEYSATATTTTVADGKEVVAAGNHDNFVRKNKTHLSEGSGASFNYGVQVGGGGVNMENSSSIVGNLYSNGPVSGSNNLIKGDVVSAGPSGLIFNIHATSSAYAHTITNSTIDKDAYYQTISGSTVGGISYPGSPDQATSTFPISDALIANMEATAEAGGIYSGPCPYNTPSTVTLGPIKINCDLNIAGDEITLMGPVWVAGTINVTGTALIKIASSLGNNSVAIIADKPTDRLNGSTITVSQSSTFQGSGTAGSFVAMISQNNSAESGGEVKAILAQNSMSGAVLLYASHGEVALENTVSLKEVTAYKLRTRNNSTVSYETGLVNLLFTGGPSGGYVFDGWREVE